MSFAVGLLLYIGGSVLVGVCVWCIPGLGGAQPAPPADHGHH